MTAGESLARVSAHLLALERWLARLPRPDGGTSVLTALTRDTLQDLGQIGGAAPAAGRDRELSAGTPEPTRPAAPTSPPSHGLEPHAGTFESRWPRRGDEPEPPASNREPRWPDDPIASSASVDDEPWPGSGLGDRPESAAGAGGAGWPAEPWQPVNEEGRPQGDGDLWRIAGDDPRRVAGDDPWRIVARDPSPTARDESLPAAQDESLPAAQDDPLRTADDDPWRTAADDPSRTAGDDPWAGVRPLLEGGQGQRREPGHGSVPRAAEGVRPEPEAAVAPMRLMPPDPSAPRSALAPPDAVPDLSVFAFPNPPGIDAEAFEPVPEPRPTTPAEEPPEAFMDRLVAELELEYTRLYGPLEG